MLVRIIELDIVDDIKNNCIKSESGLNYTKYYQDLFINCPFLNRKFKNNFKKICYAYLNILHRFWALIW